MNEEGTNSDTIETVLLDIQLSNYFSLFQENFKDLIMLLDLKRDVFSETFSSIGIETWGHRY